MYRTVAAITSFLLMFAWPAAAQSVLSGTVSGNGSPLPNTVVEALTDGTTNVVGSATSSSNGAYSISLPDATYDLRVTPPQGSGFGTETIQNVVLSADRTFDVLLVSAASAMTVSGTVTGRGGAAVPNATVFVYTGTGQQFLGHTQTDGTGHYSLTANVATLPSAISVEVSRCCSSSAVAPSNFTRWRQNIPVSGATTTADIALPAVIVSGQVQRDNGTAVPGASVSASGFHPDSTGYLQGGSSTTTDGSGNYSLMVFPGTNNFSVQPPAGIEGVLPLSMSVAVPGDTTQNLVLPSATTFTVSGTVRGRGDAAVPNATVFVYTGTGQQFLGHTQTDGTGHYSLTANVATLPSAISVEVSRCCSSSAVAPSNFTRWRQNIPVSGVTATVDIALPVAIADGIVTDSNGAPVPNVSVSGSTFAPDATGYVQGGSSASSDAAGKYRILLIKGNTNFHVSPPSQTGFLPVSLTSSIAGDITQRIVLQKPDLSPPQITSGPFVVHLSDTSVSISWTTNEPATSNVTYGIGNPTSTTTQAGLRTSHTVTLTNLTPTATYQFQVSSSDQVGNGPTVSAAGTFATQAPPGDITPPLILSGPTVVFVDQTTAIIQWTTDEPADSVVGYGLSEPASVVSGPAGVFTQTHSLTLTDLQPSTTYYAQVSSADPDGNETTSSIFSLTTLAVPDTTAPVITSGPTVESVTHNSIVVIWETDEPASSGVSYNDGSEFFLVSDPSLTRTHRMTLSGLRAETLYNITVSSIDAVGNGPTLGGPISGTTTATPDTTAPELSNVQITDITTNSALISWTTDETSTSMVRYGIVSGAPDNTRTDLTPVTSHSLTVTGLAEDTVYFFVVSSTDGSGNTSTSVELSFKTETSFVDQPPTKPGPITAPAAPINAASFDLTWIASVDDVSLTGYEVVRNGEVVALVGPDVTTYVETGLDDGVYVYEVRALDSAGHSVTSDAVTVTVDRTAPQVSVPAEIITSTTGTTAAVEYEASASDSRDGSVAVTCLPASGSPFPVGDTLVVCSAADSAGNSASASFTVTVTFTDAAPPDIASVTPSQALLWPPTHQMVALSLSISVSDSADPAPSCRITGISSNEPVNGTGDGNTAPDWWMGAGLNFAVRAERAGSGNGRVYTIAVECTDASGNRATAFTTVGVPKSPGGQ